MSVANVTMFEFQNPQSVEEFASWYKGHGTYPNNDISLFVRTEKPRPLASRYTPPKRIEITLIG